MDWSDPISLEPVHEIPTADGKGFTNRISIDRAKELNLLPRVTGIISAVLGDSWAIGQYRVREAILAGELTSRADDENDDDFVDRVAGIAGQKARRARDRGQVVHNVVKEFLTDGYLSSDPAASLVAEQFLKLLQDIDAVDVSCEMALGGLRKGYCGTPDVYVGSCDLGAVDALVGSWRGSAVGSGRGSLVIDLKCTDLNKFRKPYREHLYQFGGYAGLLDLDGNSRYVQWYADPWTGESKLLRHDDVLRWKEAFACLFRAWQIETGFDLPIY